MVFEILKMVENFEIFEFLKIFKNVKNFEKLNFFRSCVPEPLCRVLEPSVSVTYLDQSDHGDVHDILRSSKTLEPILNEKDEDNITDGDDAYKETSHFQRELNAGAIIYKLEKKDSSQNCKSV